MTLSFMSVFQCPIEVVKHIEKIYRDCLWTNLYDNRKYHPVGWDVVCEPFYEKVITVLE